MAVARWSAMGRRTMLVAVNRELRALPQHVQDSALAELAREVARDFDAGERAAAGRLQRLLDGLRKLATPVGGAGDGGRETPDELDELARARADRLADAAGVVRAFGADERRRGDRQAR